MNTEPKFNERTFMAIEEKGTINSSTDTSAPLPACPGCAMIKNEWPGEGYTHEGETYCCQGCAEGTGCICGSVARSGFSREGQKLTQAKTRPGEQRAGSLAPQGELSGERDARGTGEAIDEPECSTTVAEPK
jgi:hypothetical protein